MPNYGGLGMKTTMPDSPTTRTSALTRACEFLGSITEGSPEQESLLWFENAQHEVRLAAFIKLDTYAKQLAEERANDSP